MRRLTSFWLWDALPITGRAQTWGDEIYFKTPLTEDEENGREVVDKGDVAFWPPGQALCLFWGPTPASRGDEIRPASPVNVIGSIEGDATVLGSFRSGDMVSVERT